MIIEQGLGSKLLFSVSSQSNGNITYSEHPPTLSHAPVSQIKETKLSFKMSPNARIPLRSLHLTSISLTGQRLDSYANCPVFSDSAFIFPMTSMIVGRLVDIKHDFREKISDQKISLPEYNMNRCAMVISLFLADSTILLPEIDLFNQIRIDLGRYCIVAYFGFSDDIPTPNITWSTYPLTMPPKIDGVIQPWRETKVEPVKSDQVLRSLHDSLYKTASSFFSAAENWHASHGLPNPNSPPNQWKFSPRAIE